MNWDDPTMPHVPEKERLVPFLKKTSFGQQVWSDHDFDVGDTVEKAGGSGAESLYRSRNYVVAKLDYEFSSDTHYTPDGQYMPIYRQRVTVEGLSRGYFASNFKLVSKKGAKIVATLQIEDLKPSVAIEIDTDAAGNDVVKEGAEYLSFESGVKARAAVSKIISDSIREKNEYRRFRIFTNSVVAGAKEPEIEFK